MRDNRGLWWRWFKAVTLGEIIAFSVPALAAAAIGVLGGVVMAATVAALTGLAFLRLVRLHARPKVLGMEDFRASGPSPTALHR